MTNKDLTKFAEIMAAMAENYPGACLTGSGLDMRFEALKEFSIDQVEKAAIKLIKTRRYNSMPTTSDMITAMDGVHGQLDVDQLAEIEAGKVLGHLRCFGKNVSPCFDDPITNQLMTSRWRYYSWASTVKESDLKWWKMDFIRSYIAHHAGLRAGYHLSFMDKVLSVDRLTDTPMLLNNRA